MAFRAGKNSRAFVGGVFLATKSWDVTDKGEDLDTSNFESNGKRTHLVGLEGLDWGLNGDWDAGQNPLDDPPGLFPRDDGQDMDMYTNRTDNKFYEMPEWCCFSAHTATSAQGTVTFVSSGTSQGSYNRPSGSV